MNKSLFTRICLFSLFTSFVLVSGCSLLQGGADTSQAQQALSDAQTQLKEAQNFYNEQAKSADEVTRKQAENTLVQLGEFEKKLDLLQSGLAKATNPDGTIDLPKAGAQASLLLPPPWNLIGLGISAVGNVVQLGLQKKTANQVDQTTSDAKSIVNAIDVLRAQNPTVAQAMSAMKDKLNTVLTPGAQAIIKSESLT